MIIRFMLSLTISFLLSMHVYASRDKNDDDYGGMGTWTLSRDATTAVASVLDTKTKKTFALVCRLFYRAVSQANHFKVMPHIGSDDLETLLKRRRHTTSLDLTDAEGLSGPDILTATGLLPGLLHIKFGRTAIDSESFRKIIDEHPRLASLDIESCTNITSDDLQHLAETCKDLVQLNVRSSAINDQILACIAKENPGLKCLNIASTDITPDGLVRFFQERPTLSDLDVTGCMGLTPSSLMRAVELNHDLKSIILNDCVQVNDDLLRQIASRCISLKKIELSRCASVSSDSLLHLANSCSELTAISLAYCGHFNSEDLTQLAKASPNLKYINLEGCDKISSDALVEIAKSCQQLICFNINYSQALNSDTLQRIIDVNPGLRYLQIWGYTRLSPQEIYNRKFGKKL